MAVRWITDNSLLLAKSKQWLQCSLYVLLSMLLLSKMAIVSNIESIQQTLGIILEKAYIYSPIPLVWLVSMRSLCVMLLIIAHALKYVSADCTPSEPMAVAAVVEETPIEQPKQPVTITEEQPKPRALPSPKRKRIQRANVDNLERVRVYLLDHPKVTARQIAAVLSLSPGVANK